jgi:hypothetical protein
MATTQVSANVKNANDRLAKTAKALHDKVKAAEQTGSTVRKFGKGRDANGNKITHSYRLFSLLKKQKGQATTKQLAAVTGLPPNYVAWYMAELARVYKVKLEHKRGDAVWKAKGLSVVKVPPNGIAGRRPSNSAADPIVRPVAINKDVVGVAKAIKSGLDTLVAVLNRASITENRPRG